MCVCVNEINAPDSGEKTQRQAIHSGGVCISRRDQGENSETGQREHRDASPTASESAVFTRAMDQMVTQYHSF